MNGTLTFGAGGTAKITSLEKRGTGAGAQLGVELSTPPYSIHNGPFAL